MFGKYDINDKYNADFVYAHLLYGGERLTIAAEYGQLAVDVNPTFYTAGDTTAAGSPKWDNTLSGTLNADKVTQYSYYISAGYKFFPHSLIEYFEPVFRYEFMLEGKYLNLFSAITLVLMVILLTMMDSFFLSMPRPGMSSR